MLSNIKPNQNLIGRKFGRLSVIDIVEIDNTRNRNHTWKTMCDCGVEKITNSYCLKYEKTKSCGCFQKEQFLKKCNIYTKNIALNALVYEYKTGAKKRNLVCDLTHEEFETLFAQKCYYCNSEPFCVKKSNKHSIIYNGVDRVNNNDGYTINNVVSCCKYCNVAKHDTTFEDFLSWVKRLSDTLKDKKLI